MNKEIILQDDFLFAQKNNNEVIIVFFTNGSHIEGKIRNFDKYTLLLETENQHVLIFKHAIATITVKKP
ncbi:MAG: RNA chaperone Hfq [Candidatus Fischerbacteria bacterium RBG_13_37_8]|uniref:RNA chaperone Hfq n=1 Tax=Candidatus Fischerbacteria bacterium RBG_13_37_8 TaxID=1817863 RepID=A0A1F5V4T0_9BACT|nr:MAG: RNA chaperone Hfq [Candidatus Fischerbacteria bacterium RBG_13_37_8]